MKKCDYVTSATFELPLGSTSITLQLHDGQFNGTQTCSGTGLGSGECNGGAGTSCKTAVSGVCEVVVSLPTVRAWGPCAAHIVRASVMRASVTACFSDCVHACMRACTTAREREWVDAWVARVAGVAAGIAGGAVNATTDESSATCTHARTHICHSLPFCARSLAPAVCLKHCSPHSAALPHILSLWLADSPLPTPAGIAVAVTRGGARAYAVSRPVAVA